MIICLFPNEKKTLTIELAKGIGEFLEEKGCKVVVEDDKSSLIGYPPLSSVKKKNVKFYKADVCSKKILNVVQK